jgi:opacity protein-like surface antigen
MRKSLFLLALVLAVAGTAGPGYAAEYDRYDRYERGYRQEAPPPVAAPPARQRHAQEGEPYLIGHIGVYDPNSDSDGLNGYDSGFNFDIGIGSRVSPIFAVEGILGAFSAEDGGNEASAVPLTIGVRLIVPNPYIEPYMGAGAGVYFVGLEEDPDASIGFSGIDEDNAEFGGYFSLGADFWLNPRLALNFEGKYHWVDSTFTSHAGNDFDVDLSGWTVNFGVRLSF